MSCRRAHPLVPHLFRALMGLAGMVVAGSVLAHPAAGGEGSGKAAPRGVVASATDTVGATGTHDARTYFTDTELLTQDGRKVRFFSDVLQDKVVLINVVYTSCKDACPLITRQLTEVRARLGERFGREIFFVSLSSDPERDTPAALRNFATRNDAAYPGWTFLTGNKADVERVLARLGQLSQNVEGHSTLLIAGNVGAKRWSKIRPDAPVAAIAERLALLAGGSAGAPAAGNTR